MSWCAIMINVTIGVNCAESSFGLARLMSKAEEKKTAYDVVLNVFVIIQNLAAQAEMRVTISAHINKYKYKYISKDTRKKEKRTQQQQQQREETT